MRIEAKDNISCIRIQSVSVAKTINRIQHTKRIEVEKSGEKMEKRCTN